MSYTSAPIDFFAATAVHEAACLPATRSASVWPLSIAWRGRYAACAACAVGRVNPDEGIGPIVGGMAELLIGTMIVAFVPWTSIGFR
jgi:ABC-type glucose/galactose transport system permease subunit